MWSPDDPPHGDPEGGNVSYGVGTCRESMRLDSENQWESEKGDELELPVSIGVAAWNAIGNMCRKTRPCGERMRRGSEIGVDRKESLDRRSRSIAIGKDGFR